MGAPAGVRAMLGRRRAPSARGVADHSGRFLRQRGVGQGRRVDIVLVPVEDGHGHVRWEAGGAAMAAGEPHAKRRGSTEPQQIAPGLIAPIS
jgi:hypothetical protein